MMKIQDVAKIAGVSVGTVSNVINKKGRMSQETREKVIKIIKEVNYVPNGMAKALKANNTKHIGIIAEDISVFPSSPIIDGVCEYSKKEGYHISLTNLRMSQIAAATHFKDYENNTSYKRILNESIKQLQAMNVCGIIYVSIYPRDIQFVLRNISIPVTYCYAYSHNNDYCVNCNDFQGAKMATEYLISMGHKRIALLSGIIDTLPAHKRLMGYQTALMENKLPYVTQYVIQGSWLYEDGYRACNEFLNLDVPPTAIFSMSDYMAYGIINAAYDRGLKIPDDLSVHGFDDMQYSSFCRPSLTTVAMPLVEMGHKAAKVNIDLVEKNPPKTQGILLECEHIIRASVSHPRTDLSL